MDVNNKCILNPERDCLGLIEARRVEKSLERHEMESAASMTKQGERLGTLERQMAVHETNYLHILTTLNSINEKVTILESKPAKRWEKILTVAITAVVTALVAFVLSRLGLSA